jgi:hypothetical protein
VVFNLKCLRKNPEILKLSDAGWKMGDSAMKEIEAIRKQIKDFYDAGNIVALDRLSLVLNEVLADLALKRALLGQPEPEPEERLEMMDKDRLDKDGFEPDIPWRAKP